MLLRAGLVIGFLYVAAKYYSQMHDFLRQHGALLDEGDPWLQLILVIVTFGAGLTALGVAKREKDHQGRSLGLLAIGLSAMLLSFHWLRS